MSRVSKVSITLRLIAVAVTVHVAGVENKTKFNIGVNEIHVVSFWKRSWLDLRRGENEAKTGHPELNLYYERQTVSNPSQCISMHINCYSD